MGQRTLGAVAVGDAAPPLEHELTRTDLVAYAGASGDFNPMHHDEVKATGAGMPSVFGHGMFSMALLGRAITDWVGIANLRGFQVRFTKQTWPGDVLTTEVTVSELTRDDDEPRAVLDCVLRNQDGQEVVRGTATAAISDDGA